MKLRGGFVDLFMNVVNSLILKGQLIECAIGE